MQLIQLKSLLHLILLVALLAGQFTTLTHFHLPEVCELEFSAEDHEHEEESCALCELASGGENAALFSRLDLPISLDKLYQTTKDITQPQLSFYNSSQQRAPPPAAPVLKLA